MMYKFNEKVSVKALADLRESVGWNRMEKEYKNPLMTSYYHIAVYENDKLIGYIDSVSNGVSDAYIQGKEYICGQGGNDIENIIKEKSSACDNSRRTV